MSRRCTLSKAARAAAENTTTLEDVLEQVGQQAAETLSVTKDALEDLYDHHVAPRVSEAVDKVAPTVTQAYENLSERIDGLQPKLASLRDQVVEAEPVELLGRRGRKKVSLPIEKAPRRRHCPVGRILTVVGLTGVVAALVVLARKFLGTGDDGWAPAAQPSGWSPEPRVRPQDTAKRAAQAPADQAATEETEGYGEGAYVGDNPPEGFVIKGNERSMKYHTPHAAGYERTNADVWFDSEAAAQAAGFTRATR